MSFNICLIDEVPNMDVLPVALIKNYPLEKRDYKPYTQVKICISKEDFIFQVLAFEAKPNPKSQIKIVLCIDTILPLNIDIYNDKNYNADVNNIDITNDINVHYFSGEDLQGVYWGADITISNVTIKKFYKNYFPLDNTFIYGNLFKLCREEEHQHFGSYYPVDFNLDNPYNQCGKFLITQY